MIRVLVPLVEALFPRRAARSAARAGIVCLLLAAFVAILFPAAARAGTETPSARWVTTGALAVAGLVLRLSGGRLAVIGGGLVALVIGAFAAPANWLILHAALCALYCAASFVPRAGRASQVRDTSAKRDLARFAGGGLIAVFFGRFFDVQGPDEDDLEPRFGGTHEVIESLATALVLALVVREFGFEAFKIPTGSMEPTILGDGRDRQGDRLLAFKPIEFRRWDIVVFKFPLFRNTNYIKRLIGLPGERLELRSGDVYVNGTIAPKPDDVQTVMWRKTFSAGQDEDWVRDFDPDSEGAWKLRPGFAEVAAKGDAVAWMQARRGFEEDLKVSFDLEVANSAGGQLTVALEGAGRRCELVLDAATAHVTGPGLEANVEGLSLAAFAQRKRVGFSMSDRIARVFLDGRQIASFAHADRQNEGLEQGRARLGAKNLTAVVRDFAGENDVQYTKEGVQEWDIPSDGYVMLGDNTGSSRDSRRWTANVVRTKDGREFVAPTTARVTEERDEVVFRQRPDGGVEFLDSYGIPRSFTAAEIAEIRREVPQPFAWRSDLVGRAFLIFFPFRSAGEFRPRLLR